MAKVINSFKIKKGNNKQYNFVLYKDNSNYIVLRTDPIGSKSVLYRDVYKTKKEAVDKFNLYKENKSKNSKIVELGINNSYINKLATVDSYYYNKGYASGKMNVNDSLIDFITSSRGIGNTSDKPS